MLQSLSNWTRYVIEAITKITFRSKKRSAEGGNFFSGFGNIHENEKNRFYEADADADADAEATEATEAVQSDPQKVTMNKAQLGKNRQSRFWAPFDFTLTRSIHLNHDEFAEKIEKRDKW